MVIKLACDKNKVMFYSNSPLFETAIPINESMILLVMKRKSIHLASPIQIGISVLDLAKARLFEYWYQVFKQTKDIKSSSVISFDTDGALIFSETDSMYQFMAKNPEWHDLSNLDPHDPVHSKFFSDKNRGI